MNWWMPHRKPWFADYANCAECGQARPRRALIDGVCPMHTMKVIVIPPNPIFG